MLHQHRARSVKGVVTHFEIWGASQICAVMDQSHRIWQRNSSAAHGPGSWNRRIGALGLLWLFLQPNNSQSRNYQIRNTRISTASVTPARNPGEAPRRSSQSRHCHLFHLFYQVHIRLGSPHSSPRCFRYLHPNNSHPALPNRPAQPIGAFPKLHQTRTLWQF
jgi:hypothetical protein